MPKQSKGHIGRSRSSGPSCQQVQRIPCCGKHEEHIPGEKDQRTAQILGENQNDHMESRKHCTDSHTAETGISREKGCQEKEKQ